MPVDWLPYLAVTATPATADIAQMEGELGVALPDDYRRTLLGHQGQKPSRQKVRVGRGANVFGPLLFVGRSSDPLDETYSVAFAVDQLKGWKGIGDAKTLRLYPFATNTADGLFCFDYRMAGPPRVVFVSMDRDPDEPDAMVRVADSFTALVKALED